MLAALEQPEGYTGDTATAREGYDEALLRYGKLLHSVNQSEISFCPFILCVLVSGDLGLINADLHRTLEGLKAADVPKTKALYMALLRSTGRARRAELVLRVFDEMKTTAKIEGDTAVYNQLLNAMRLCGRLEVCESIFEQMKSSKKAQPDRISSLASRRRPSGL